MNRDDLLEALTETLAAQKNRAARKARARRLLAARTTARLQAMPWSVRFSLYQRALGDLAPIVAMDVEAGQLALALSAASSAAAAARMDEPTSRTYAALAAVL